jgi:hypothetical protein
MCVTKIVMRLALTKSCTPPITPRHYHLAEVSVVQDSLAAGRGIDGGAKKMDNAIELYKLDVDKSQINQPLYQPGPITVGPRPHTAKPGSETGG